MNKIYQKSFPGVKNAGFTLIELLVVVLIIGILSAVALPQYTKAVWKSRAAELQTLVKAVGQAQEVYFMATGHGAYSFDELDVSLPLTPMNGLDLGLATTDMRGNERYVVILNNRPGGDNWANTCAYFIVGPYAGSGFCMVQNNTINSSIPSGRVLCGGSDEFCINLMQGRRIGIVEGRPVYSFL